LFHQFQDVDFFGHALGSIDHLDSNLFSSMGLQVDINVSKETYRFLTYLNLASCADLDARQETAIDDLAKSVLEIIRFDQKGTVLCTRCDIPFSSSCRSGG
jgi:hypothetical protein